ncbi:UDP-N-acetylglucosamine 2-epimerase [Ekhidna sp.]|uniref:UDP-N-acetylglucosamine 2-epimerase n=1 Tax=Ekhidna sp. TaxID=2608089 RepID=UPI003CCC28FE
MKKICVVITARPSYSRIKTALEAIAKHPKLELYIVVSASAVLNRYGNAVDILEEDGFEIHSKLYTVLEGESQASMAKTTALGILELSTVFQNLSPDAVVTIADRFETMSTAIAASYMNIPLIHIQGGEITGNIDEKVRHSITKLSDLHLVATEKAKERVIKLGEESSKVFVTGCPSIDLAKRVVESSNFLDFDPFQKYGGVGELFDISNGYYIVLQHPVTTSFDSAKEQVLETLHALNAIEMPTLWFWPNVDAGSDGTSKGIRTFRELVNPEKIHFFKNMHPDDFLKLLIHSKGIIGNSSVAIRECSYLGVPAINIGDRQKNRERGKNVIDTDYTRDKIIDAINSISNLKLGESDYLYGNGQSGEQIAQIISDFSFNIEKQLTY